MFHILNIKKIFIHFKKKLIYNNKMNLFNFLKNFDYLAPSQVLYIKGHKSFKTYVGAIISLLVFGLVFSLLIYFFYKLIARENLYIAIQEESFINSFTYNISNSLFIFKINSDIDLYDNEIKFNAKYHQFNLSNNQDIKIMNLDIELCKEENIDKSIKKIDKINNISSFYCLVPSNDYLLITDLNNGIDSYLNLEINLCDNNSNSTCKSRDEIIQKLNGHLLEFYFISQTHYVNNYNHKNPLLKTPVEEKVALNLGTITNRTYFFEKINYNSDNGIIFENKEKYEGFLFPIKTRYSINIRNNFNEPLGGFFFSIDKGQRQRYERKYQKLQEICAYIGGILSFLNFIGSFIVSAYNEQFFFYEIISDIFNPMKTELKGNLRCSILYPGNYRHSLNKFTNSSKAVLKILNNPLNLIKSPQNSKINNIEIYKKINNNNNENLNISYNNTNIKNNNNNNKSSNNISYVSNSNIHGFNKKPRTMLNIPKLKFCDLLCSVCFNDNPKSRFLDHCQELVYNTLSCEDLIKNSVNLERLIQIGEFSDKDGYWDLFPIQLRNYINKDYIANSFHMIKNNDIQNNE